MSFLHAVDYFPNITTREGVVKYYRQDKGFGFIETDTGDYFFHVSGARQLKHDVDYGVTSIETFERGYVSIEAGVTRLGTILPFAVTKGMSIFFIEGTNDGKPIAEMWFNKADWLDVVSVAIETKMRRRQLVESFKTYLLQRTWEEVIGPPRANNELRIFETPVRQRKEQLFLGTDVQRLLEIFRTALLSKVQLGELALLVRTEDSWEPVEFDSKLPPQVINNMERPDSRYRIF